MKIRFATFTISTTMAVLLSLTGCGNDSGVDGTGPSTDGTGPSTGRGSDVTTSDSSGASGSTGLSTATSSSGGSSGTATGGIGSGGGATTGTTGGLTGSSSSVTTGGGTTTSSGSSTQGTIGGSDSGGGTTASSTGSGSDGSGSDGGDAIPPTFETFQKVIMAQACFGAGCHNDPQNPLSLTLNDQLYTRLTTTTSKACQNLKVVNPGNPDQSALVKLLNGPCGSLPRMPEVGNPIPAEYIAAITTWIMNGAPKQ